MPHTKIAVEKLRHLRKLNIEVGEKIIKIQKIIKNEQIHNNTLMSFNDITCELREEMINFINFVCCANFNIQY